MTHFFLVIFHFIFIFFQIAISDTKNDKRHASISSTDTKSFDRISKGKFCFCDRSTKRVDKIDMQIVGYLLYEYFYSNSKNKNLPETDESNLFEN